MRTATTTKDERRGGVVGKRKKGAMGFIALPLRSQDHLITFPTQLYLGREFDVSIRIEIGLIPIRTTLVHTANMGPREGEHYSGHSLHAGSPEISACVALYYNQASLSFYSPFIFPHYPELKNKGACSGPSRPPAVGCTNLELPFIARSFFVCGIQLGTVPHLDLYVYVWETGMDIKFARRTRCKCETTLIF